MGEMVLKVEMAVSRVPSNEMVVDVDMEAKMVVSWMWSNEILL